MCSLNMLSIRSNFHTAIGNEYTFVIETHFVAHISGTQHDDIGYTYSKTVTLFLIQSVYLKFMKPKIYIIIVMFNNRLRKFIGSSSCLNIF